MQQAELTLSLTTIKACQKAIKKGLKGFTREQTKTLSTWAASDFYLSKESSYTEGNWVAIPWQVAIMDCLSHDDIQIINWIKSARVGATKIMLASIGYHAAHKPRNQLFYQPTDEDAKEFVKTELDTMIRDVPSVQKSFPHFGTKNSKNTDKIKMFLSSMLYIKGGKSPTNYRRISTDIVYYDELEGFDRDISGEGDPLKLGDKRNEGSLFKKSVRMTTPKNAADSLIEKEANKADYFFRYQVPCPHCSEYQTLAWSGMNWINNDPNTVKYQCKHCQALIENEQLHTMLEQGFWLSECGVEIVLSQKDDENITFVNVNGVEVATPKSVSFHIWTAYSPFVAWSVLVSEYLSAKKLIKEKGDITEFKTFVNTTLGETWRDKEQSTVLNKETLFNRREHTTIKNHAAIVNNKALVLMGGFDTQDDRIEGEIRAFGLEGENYLIEYFILYGDPALPTLWDKLEQQVLKSYQKQNGELINIERVCIDSGGHFTDEVYAFCKRFTAQRVIPSKGASTYDKPLATLNPKRNEQGVKLAIIGTDTAKDVIYNWLQITCRSDEESDSEKNNKLSTENGDNLNIQNSNEKMSGYCHHPISDFTPRDYFAQLCSETKILKKHQGKMRWVYDNQKRRNEPIDCFVGSLAALRLSENYFGLSLTELANPHHQSVSFSDVAKKLGKK